MMRPQRTDHSRARHFHLAVIFWIGFAALIYQIYSVRILFMFFVENTHAVATAISSFLAGLASSSLLFSRLTHRNTRNLAVVCWMMIAASAYGYFVLSNYQWIPELLDAISHAVTAVWLVALLKYVIVWFYLFLPAFFLGGAFPLINGLYLHSLNESSRDTGMVYFWDTLGAIAGALLAGFVLLPLFGPRVTVAVAATINLLIAVTLMPRRLHAYGACICLFIIVTSVAVYDSGESDPRFSSTARGTIVPATSDLDRRFGTVLFQRESPFGHVTVGQSNGSKMLFIDYRAMCESTGTTEREFARLILPQLAPRSELLTIGLGCGFTASELSSYPRTKKLDIVEINPIVPQAARFFAKENHEVLDAQNIDLHIIDGAQWLRIAPRKYDAIAIDVEQVSVIYSSPLFTREYFAIAKSRLKENGIFGLWSLTVSPQFTRVMYNTLSSVFPYVSMRTYAEGSTTYYASMHPLQLPPNRLAEVKGFSKKVMEVDSAEINTLEDRALEKYYNLNKNIGLPADYHEDDVRPWLPPSSRQ